MAQRLWDIVSPTGARGPRERLLYEAVVRLCIEGGGPRGRGHRYVTATSALTHLCPGWTSRALDMGTCRASDSTPTPISLLGCRIPFLTLFSVNSREEMQLLCPRWGPRCHTSWWPAERGQATPSCSGPTAACAVPFGDTNSWIAGVCGRQRLGLKRSKYLLCRKVLSGQCTHLPAAAPRTLTNTTDLQVSTHDKRQ